MRKSILFIGNGKWSKKIISIISKSSFFNEIFIKDRSAIKNINGNSNNFSRIKNNFIHLCTPINIQKKLISRYSFYDNIIVEKNFSTTKKFFNKFINKKNINLFYIDLYHSAINFIKKKIEKKNITFVKISYKYNKKKYKNFQSFINDWIDHPIYLCLYLFDLKKQIIISEIKIKKSLFIQLTFKVKNMIFLIEIDLQKKRKRNERIISLFYKENNIANIIIYNFLKKKLSIGNLYKKKYIKYINDNPFINFYKYHSRLSSSNLGFANIVYEQKFNIYKQIKLLNK